MRMLPFTEQSAMDNSVNFNRTSGDFENLKTRLTPHARGTENRHKVIPAAISSTQTGA